MASSIKNLSDFSHIKVANANPFKFGIVVAQWNAEITGALLNGAISGLEKHGAQEENIKIIIVDITGKSLAERTLKTGNNTINISSFANGVYFIKTEKSGSVKFIKD